MPTVRHTTLLHERIGHIMSKPHKTNACAGYFDDWLEVNLLPECNGKCTWCVEKEGYHPKERASWELMLDAIKQSDKKNIVLLGGEPMLYKDLKKLILGLRCHGKNVYLTTNGSQLSYQAAQVRLCDLTGINISIHHYDLAKNKDITGIDLDFEVLYGGIKALRLRDITVRLNCNVIKGQIDTKDKIEYYILFAKYLGADSVRFAELKNDDKNFRSLYVILNGMHDLNANPYKLGCHRETTINDMPVSLRQMCGLHTKKRPKPDNPEQVIKPVLYYDGKMYPGWVLKMTDTDFDKCVNKLVKEGTLTVREAAELKAAHYKALAHSHKTDKAADKYNEGVGCVY